MARRIIPLVLSSALLAFPASAIDLSLCADDGVTEVPYFAERDPATGCLMLDPGNGDPAVPFQYEFFHGPGPGDHDWQTWGAWTDDPDDCDADTPGVQPCGYDLALVAYGRCRTKSGPDKCTTVIWDAFLDNYVPHMKGEDTYRGNAAAEYLFVKDTTFANNWRCDGGFWNGPNGLFCDGEDTSEHVDGIQFQRTPANGGWLVLQDVEIVNSLVLHLLNQTQTEEHPPNGSTVYQGVRFAQETTPVGLATNWVDDCLDRGTRERGCTRTTWQQNYISVENWIIDSYGALWVGKFDQGKTVLVNTGCGFDGCGGAIEYRNGWPHPYQGSSGPGECPNGLMPGSCTTGSTNCYCYTSIEEALADTYTETSGLGDCPDCPHQAPPFIQLSTTGWESPPICARSCLQQGLDQTDTNGDGYGNACDADITNDGIVGAPDYPWFSLCFGKQEGSPEWSCGEDCAPLFPGVVIPEQFSGCRDVDLDVDGAVGASDFALFGPAFGSAPGPNGEEHCEL